MEVFVGISEFLITHLFFKRCLYVGVLFLFFEVKAQKKEESTLRHFWLPKQSTFDVYSDFNWGFENNLEENQWVNQLRFRSRFDYTKSLSFVFVNETRFIPNEKDENKWTQIYLNYRKRFKHNNKVPFFKYGANMRLKIGVLEWFPTFNNIQLILDNTGLYLDPEAFFGGSMNLDVPLVKSRALVLFLGGHSGDLIGDQAEAVLQNAYLRYRKKLLQKQNTEKQRNKQLTHDLSMDAQVGLAQGRKHLVNHIYLTYAPTLEQVKLTFKLGKLPALDETPYGFHIGFRRKFKHISLGGYYERRLEQDNDDQIAGFSWSIISSSKVLKLINTFSMRYNLITNSFSMFIPILKIDVK